MPLLCQATDDTAEELDQARLASVTLPTASVHGGKPLDGTIDMTAVASSRFSPPIAVTTESIRLCACCLWEFSHDRFTTSSVLAFGM